MTIPIQSSSTPMAPAEGVRWPNLFIVGAPKCGTTAICDQLGQHPDIYIPERKELHYWDSDQTGHAHNVKTSEEYLSYYEGQHEPVLGEGTVWYLYSALACEQISNFCPDAKIIISLRNPIEVVHSLFHFRRFLDSRVSVIENCIHDEIEMLANYKMHKEKINKNLILRSAGLYYFPIERWINRFGKENIYVILYDDYISSNSHIFRKLLMFLDVDPLFEPKYEKINSTLVKRSHRFGKLFSGPPKPFHRAAYLLPTAVRRKAYSYLLRSNISRKQLPPLDPALKRSLIEFYRDDVEKLSGLLDRDLSHWLAD